MKNEVKEYIFSAFTLALSVFFLYKSLAMPKTAALLPMLTAGLVFIFSVAMAYQAYRTARPEKAQTGYEAGAVANEENVANEEKVNVGRVIWYVAMMALYIYFISSVGYFIVTPIFMLVCYVLLKATGIPKAIAISAGFAIFIYFLFVSFLKLPIPLGLMESLF
jgi:hypothetical protein